MKVEYSMDGKRNFLYPFKVYSYRKIKDSLQNLLNRPIFLQLLEKTHLADQREKMNDIYRSFLDSDGSLFFKNKRNIGVLANLDWFNPFKRTEYSMGVLYLVFINIPRSQRFKWKNIIILGIIPGPKEPSLTINSYLRPHIDELLKFWDGVVMIENKVPTLYKIALIGSSSDVPASRKFNGFMAHNANKGKQDFRSLKV